MNFRENWYRDLWLLAITIISLLSVKANSARITEAKQNRFDSAVAACVEQNDRNTLTIAELVREISHLSSDQRKQGEKALIPTVLLINELAPYRADCLQFARERIIHPSAHLTTTAALTSQETMGVARLRIKAESLITQLSK